MTERAQRAADELRGRGWGLNAWTSRECPGCGTETDAAARYCSACGHKLPADDGTLVDLEAAIVAALQERPSTG